MKPRILIIENSIAITGALKSIVRSSLSLRSQYEFLFVLPRNSAALPYVRQNGFECFEFDMHEIRKNFLALVLYVPFLIFNTIRLFRLLRQHRIDLISNNDFYNLLPSCYRLFGGRVHYVSYVRFLPDKFPAILVRLWYSAHLLFSHRIIAVSEAVKRKLKPSAKLTVIPNELPQGEIVYTQPFSNRLLYVANYIAGKGQDAAIDSFALIHDIFPDWTLKFVGGDMGLEKNKLYKQQLIQRAKDLGLEAKIEWCDFQEDIIHEYYSAGIVLNFSESESFSLTCLEAMFYGRPVIATRCGGPEEIIEHDCSGMLVPIADTKLMAITMERLMKDAAERNRLSLNAFKSIRVRFDYKNTIGKLELAYQKAIDGINTF